MAGSERSAQACVMQVLDDELLNCWERLYACVHALQDIGVRFYH